MPSSPSPEQRERLLYLRTQLDLTKSAAARLAGVSRREWHEAEEGPREQPAETDERAQQIAEMIALFEEINGG